MSQLRMCTTRVCLKYTSTGCALLPARQDLSSSGAVFLFTCVHSLWFMHGHLAPTARGRACLLSPKQNPKHHPDSSGMQVGWQPGW